MLALLFAAVFGSIVDEINNDPTSTWVAVEYHPSIITPAKFRAMLSGHVPRPASTFSSYSSGAYPEEFDARDKWGAKILPVRNQGQCGSGWAFAIAEVLGDREDIAGCPHNELSAQDLVSCDTTDLGCNGGSIKHSWDWVEAHGIAEEGCIPYVSGGGRVPACPSKCKNGSAIVRHKITEWHFCKSLDEIFSELVNNGPVTVTFDVYSDFFNYKSGVYEHKTGYLEGDAEVLLIGYGTESGTPYWLCQNSWGTSWGEQGYFKFLRRNNHCNIESYAGVVTVKCPN